MVMTTEHPIDIKKVNDLYEEIDKILDNHIKDHELNFMEIDTALMLVKKKMSYEETGSWLQFMIAGQREEAEGEDQEDKSKPKGDMYG
jgi:hypothetical protein